MKPFPYKIIDLTHTLDASVPSWDGSCGFNHDIKCDYSDCDGPFKFRIQQINMVAGIGTHMDAPAHCISGGTTIDEIPVADLVSPCIVIDVSQKANERYCVSTEDILNFEQQHGSIQSGSFVMIRTGWERFWQQRERYHNQHVFPSVSADAAQLLIDRNITGLGIDTLSPDCPENGYPVHHILLRANKYIIENAANLALLPLVGSYILALPIKTREGTEAVMRLVAFV